MLSRRREYAQGNTLYPSPSAGNGKTVTDPFTGKADGWNGKCCGFWCAAERVAVPGTINEGDGDITRTAVTGGFEPNVGNAGCPFCGSGASK